MSPKTKKYKVIIDTNIIWMNNEDKISKLVNCSLVDSSGFILENKLSKKVILAIPEIVIQERIEQVLCQINEIVKKIENSSIQLNGFGVSIPNSSYKKKYRDKVVRMMDEFLKSNNIEVLKTPKFDQKKLLERALRKDKPFKGEGDKGLKDTIIWLTILDDAKIYKDLEYIFCTKNISDFGDKTLELEFSKMNEGKIKILENIQELKEFLDKEFDLKLKLKEKYKIIEENFKKELGSLMVKFHEYTFREKNAWEFMDVVTTPGFFSCENSTDDDVVGYNFKNIYINDISEYGKEKDNNVVVDIDLFLLKKYKNDKKIFQPCLGNPFFDSKNVTFHLLVIYNSISGSLEILSADQIARY